MGIETALRCGILDSNSSGQGYHSDYAANPYHELITSAGFEYSHTTPVVYGDTPVLHHTYKREARKIGVHKSPGSYSWRWGAKTSSASGHETTGSTIEGLARYLKNLRDKRR